MKDGGSGFKSHSAMDIFDMFFGGGSRRKEKRTKDMVYPLRVSHNYMECLTEYYYVGIVEMQN